MPPKTSNFKRQKDDFYASPAGVITPLLRHVWIPPGPIWEPCAGDGALLDQLSAEGHQVIASDLVDRGHPAVMPRIDFLMETKPPEGVSTIISNPPYNLADDFVRHALHLGIDQVIMLLRWQFLGATGPRWDITQRISDVVLMGRLSMIGNGEDKGMNGTTDFAWFCFRQQPQTAVRIFNSKSKGNPQ